MSFVTVMSSLDSLGVYSKRKESSDSSVEPYGQLVDDDIFLRPNEKLFVHCCTIFLITFRCLATKEATVHSKKLKNFMEAMADVCCIPLLDINVRDRLLTQSRFQAESFTYYLHIYLLNSEGINHFATRSTEDKVYLVAEFFDDKNKIHSKSMQIFQFRANGPWLASYDYISKTMETMFIHLPDSVIDNDQVVTLKLVIEREDFTCKQHLCPLVKCYNKQSMVIFALTPSQIHWDGTRKYFNVSTGLVSGSPNIRILLKLKWALRPKLSRGGYNLFRKSWALHDQLLTRFFHFKWRKRTFQSPESVNCSGSQTDRVAIVAKSACTEDTSRNFYWDNLPIIDSNNKTLETAPQFCICSEWCSIYAFYHTNPIVCFILGQNQHLFLLPDECVIPFHFKAICSFINTRNFPCSSMLSSVLKAVHCYIKIELAEREGANEGAFYRNKGARLLEDGYWLLRDWFNTPVTPEISKCPVDDHVQAMAYYSRVLRWLKATLKNIKDNKLERFLKEQRKKIRLK